MQITNIDPETSTDFKNGLSDSELNELYSDGDCETTGKNIF